MMLKRYAVIETETNEILGECLVTMSGAKLNNATLFDEKTGKMYNVFLSSSLSFINKLGSISDFNYPRVYDNSDKSSYYTYDYIIFDD